MGKPAALGRAVTEHGRVAEAVARGHNSQHVAAQLGASRINSRNISSDL